MKTILVTGGAGYIGSHVCKRLKEEGFEPVTFDNFSHGHEFTVRWGPFVYGDLQNSDDLDKAFCDHAPEAVIHLAGSIHLRESIENPHKHYYNNVVGSLTLLKAMAKHGVKDLVFSSSAAIYGDPQSSSIRENHPKNPMNPYGRTKWIVEQFLPDFERAHGLKSVSLRYFNAAGAHPDGDIGEAHNPETHLIPRVLFTAQKKQSHFCIYSNTLPTPDGTAIRDFVHVCDLATAHVQALHWLKTHQKSTAFNLGTGKGHSVLDVIYQAKRITGCSIDVKIENRNLPESPILVADPTYANRELNWQPIYSDLNQILETAWKWHLSLVPVGL